VSPIRKRRFTGITRSFLQDDFAWRAYEHAMETFFGFAAAGLALAGSPGPATLSLAAASAAFGASRSVAYMIGLDLGMVAVMAITVSGVAGLLLTIPGAAPILATGAALYFIYLAWRIATAPPLTSDNGVTQPPSFAAGVLLSLVNPKGYAAMAALFSGFVLIGEDAAIDALLKVAILTLVIAAVNIAWLFLGVAMTRVFRHPRLNRIVNIVFAILLLASLVPLLL
jgi:threonine/homoserine/homoserine lactone efflux protein